MIDKMYIRIEEMKKYLEEPMQERYRHSCAEIQKLFVKNSKEIWREIQASFVEVFQKTSQMQLSEQKEKVKYLTISYLKHSFHIERWCFLLQTYDETFYLDVTETTSYYYPDLMRPYFKKDMAFLEDCLKKEFVRIKAYELEGISNEYVYYYNSIILKLMEDLLPYIYDISLRKPQEI